MLVPLSLMALLALGLGAIGGDIGRPWAYGASAATALVVVGAVLLYGTKMGRVWRQATSLLYVVSVSLLIFSQSPGSSGFTVMFMLPVVAVAVVGTKRESASTCATIAVALFVVSMARKADSDLILRSVLLWGAMAVAISLTIHNRRDRVRVAQGNLRRQAEIDPLTGVPNRRGFAEALARRGAGHFAMFSIDVDGLKEVNDLYGHGAGDELLRAVARTCRTILRPNDVMGRVGGDEFAVFLPQTSAEDAAVVAERLRLQIRALPIGQCSGSASVGIAYGNATDDPNDVLSRADTEMYANKVRHHQVSGQTRAALA